MSGGATQGEQSLKAFQYPWDTLRKGWDRSSDWGQLRSRSWGSLHRETGLLQVAVVTIPISLSLGCQSHLLALPNLYPAATVPSLPPPVPGSQSATCGCPDPPKPSFVEIFSQDSALADPRGSRLAKYCLEPWKIWAQGGGRALTRLACWR